MSDMSPAEAVFFAALEKADPAERAAFLDQACAGQPELRARVDKMLAAHPKVGAFLEPAEASTRSMPAPAAANTVVAGKYKLLQQIGEGGMGSVWMADQTEPVKRRVAVKLIRIDRANSATILARFEAERQAIALMDHPNVAKLLDAGSTAEGRPYFVMELVKGVPLIEFCDSHKLGIPERLDLFMKVCQAVQHAHQKGIIHRDLKPTNVLVESHDGMPVPKVIDFGLAKATTGLQLTEHTLFTAFGSVLGTPLYMAPEQATFNALDVDTRADIYALGVILYELLTGTTPLTRETMKQAALDELLRLIREQDAMAPSSRLSSSDTAPTVAANRQTEPAKLGRLVKGELDWIVLKALAKDRDRRYETANGFARDIERFLIHEPVTAGPPTAIYRIRKFIRRNRPQVVAASVVLLTLVLGVIGTTLGLLHAIDQRRLADQARADEADQRIKAETAAEAERLAKNDAETQKKLAMEREADAEARFVLAQKAIATFHTGVTQDVLLKNPQFKALRLKLLKEAGRFYNDLETLLKGKTDEKSRQLLAISYSNLGGLMAAIGDQKAALSVHRKALALRRELAAGPAADAVTRLAVAESLGSVGGLLEASGDMAGALELYNEHRRITAALDEESPTPAVRAMLALSHRNVGYLLSRTGDSIEGLHALEQSRDTWQKLADTQPALIRNKVGLADTQNAIGLVHHRAGRLPQALQAFEAARSIQQELADAGRGIVYRRDLAQSYNNIGEVLRDMGKPGDALWTYRTGQQHWQGLARAFPAVGQIQTGLAMSHWYVGDFLLRSGNPCDALLEFQYGLGIMRVLASANPTVTEYQRHLTDQYNGIGDALLQMGKPSESLETFEHALKIGQKLTDASPTVALYQRNLANTHDAVGLVLSRIGKPAEALPVFEKALALRQKLVRDDPNNREYQSSMLATQYKIGVALAKTGKPAHATETWERVIAYRKRLAADNPGVAKYQSELAMAHHDVGQALLEMGKLVDAFQAHEKALAIREKLVELNPTSTEHRNNLAISHFNIGWILGRTGKAAAAVQAHEKARGIFRKLVDADPASRERRRVLATSYNNLGREYARLKDFARAFTVIEESLALRRRLVDSDAANTRYANDLGFSYSCRGNAHALAGHPAEAAADLRRAIELFAKDKAPDSEIRFERARALAILAGLATDGKAGVTAGEAAAFAEQAVAGLRDAFAAGWWLRDELKEADFDAIRQRADFRKLVEELTPKSPGRQSR